MDSTEKIILKKRSKQKLLTFRVTRGINGVDIFLQSEVLENFFKKYGMDTYSDNWCGNLAYQLPVVRQHYTTMLSNWFGELMVNGDYPNMSFIRAKGIKDGVTFTLENNVYTRGEIMNFTKKFKEEITGLYNDYIKPVMMEVEMTTEIRSE